MLSQSTSVRRELLKMEKTLHEQEALMGNPSHTSQSSESLVNLLLFSLIILTMFAAVILIGWF